MCFQLVLQWQVRRSSNLDWTIPLPCQIPCVHPNTPPLAPYTKGGLLLHALVCQSPCQGSRGATTTQAMLEPGAPGGFQPFFYAVLGDFFLDDLLRFPTVFLVPFLFLSHWPWDALVFGSFQLGAVFSTKQTSVDVFNIIFRIPTKHWKINDFSQSPNIFSPENIWHWNKHSLRLHKSHD